MIADRLRKARLMAGLKYDLMMEAADRIRALEYKVDSLYGKLTEREKLINNLPYGTYSWFHLAPQDDICVTRIVELGENNELQSLG